MQRSINVEIGSYLRHWVLATRLNFGANRAKMWVTQAYNVYM